MLSDIVDIILTFSSTSVIRAAYPLDKRISSLLKTAGFWHNKMQNDGLPILELNLEHVLQYLNGYNHNSFRLWHIIYTRTVKARITALGILFINDIEQTPINDVIEIIWDNEDFPVMENVNKCIRNLFPDINYNHIVIRINKDDNGKYTITYNGKVKDTVDRAKVEYILTYFATCNNLLIDIFMFIDSISHSYEYNSCSKHRKGIWDAYMYTLK